jgi:hypothetical protein
MNSIVTKINHNNIERIRPAIIRYTQNQGTKPTFEYSKNIQYDDDEDDDDDDGGGK